MTRVAWPDQVREVIRHDEPLARWCWLGIGGAAEYFAEPNNPDQLQALVLACRHEQRPIRIIGAGSNLLIHDHGVPGVVLHLGERAFGTIEVVGNRMRAGGGASLNQLIASSIQHGLAGLEALVGIPGTVGGALHTNAGDRASDVGSLVESITVMNWAGEIQVRDRSQVQFNFRESSLDELVVLDATLELRPDDREELTRRMQKQWIVRRSREPTRDLRTGYLFKDPPGYSATELIEQAGLKGTTVGGAGLFERNVNFVVASPEATCTDVLQLIDLVRDRVKYLSGIELEQAIQVW